MAKRSKTPPPPTDAETVVRELVRHPPSTEGELEARLAKAPKPALRQHLVEEFMRKSRPEETDEMLSAAIELVGIGAERKRLEDFALDRDQPRLRRAQALTLLAEGDPSSLQELLDRLPPEDALLPVEEMLERLLIAASEDETVGEHLGALMAQTPPAFRSSFAMLVEQRRQDLKIPAASLYASVLENPALEDIRPGVLAAVVEEGGDVARDLLTVLRDTAPRDDIRRAFQGALLRLGSAEIEPDKKPKREGMAYVSICDGDGGFMVFAAARRGAKRVTLGNLMLRVTGEIRDGFMMADVPDAQLKVMLKEMPPELRPLKVTLEQAAAMVELARSGPQGDMKVPGEAKISLAFLSQIPPAPLPEVKPAAHVTAEQVQALLEQPSYQSWAIAPDDVPNLESANLAKRDEWIARTSRQLAAAPAGDLIRCMTRYMMYYHALAGEMESASLLAAVLRELEARAFEKNPLVNALVQRMLDWSEQMEEEEEPLDVVYGDVALRKSLRSEFFHALKKPVGRELAHLDFTEVALNTFQDAMRGVRAEDRPIPPMQREFAYFVGKLLADEVISGHTVSALKIAEQLEKQFGSRMDPNHLRTAIMSLGPVFESLQMFVEEVCGGCPVYCLGKPKANVTDAFYSDVHPADQEPK